VRLKVYRCDRCGKIFYLNIDEVPFTLKTESELHFCQDCEASFSFFMEYTDEFDKLADKLAEKEASE